MNKQLTDELYHYGVLGMKWGVRRYQDYGEGGYNPKKKGIFRPKGERKPSQKEHIKSMSDTELDAGIKRLQKEHQYRDLLIDDISAGEKIARGVLLTGAAVGVAVGANVLASKLKPGVVKDGKAIAAAALATFGAVTIDSIADKMGKATASKTIKETMGGEIHKTVYPKK